MNGPRAGQEYTGKHRRDGALGLADPLSRESRAESYARPNADGRSATGAMPLPGTRPESGFRPEAGPRADAG